MAYPCAAISATDGALGLAKGSAMGLIPSLHPSLGNQITDGAIPKVVSWAVYTGTGDC